METEAYRTDVAAVAASLQTNVYKGLAHAEAASRLLGPNELTGKRPLPSEVPGAVHRKLGNSLDCRRRYSRRPLVRRARVALIDLADCATAPARSAKKLSVS